MTGRPIKAGDALRKKLARLGLVTEDDLLLHLPLRYEDETRLTPVARSLCGEPVLLEVEVRQCEVQIAPRRQLVAHAFDASGDISLRFLNFYPRDRKSVV